MRRRGLVLAVLAVLAFAIVLGALAYRRVAGQAAARDEVDRAESLIERVDATIRRIDATVRAPIEPEVADETAELREELPETQREAREAARLLVGAAPRLPADERQRASDAADAVVLRERLLEASGPLLEATERSARALGPAEEAWSSLLSAEERADRAVELYNRLERDDVRESLKLVAQARDDARKARAMFQESAAAMPQAELDPYVEYAEGRLEQLDLAERADEAFLDGDIGEANTLSDRYNERERDLVAAAERLPDSPADPIDAGYDEIAGDSTERYFELREQLSP